MDYKYGLLKSTALNLGDEVQSAVLRPFLPRVDEYLDGAYLHKVKSNEKIKLVIHGCFNTYGSHWPPSPCIEPLITSLHIGENVRDAFTSRESVEYFKQYEPIGCRDLPTADLLRSKGVATYFSGCITFLLERYEGPRTEETIVSDLHEKALRLIPERVLKASVVLRHGEGVPWERIASTLSTLSPTLHALVKRSKVHLVVGRVQQELVRAGETSARTERRLVEARNLLSRYARAKLVVTSRLHGALPCVALGTPVILIPNSPSDSRLPGLVGYTRHYSVEEFERAVKTVDFDSPEPNPKSVDGLRRQLTQVIKEFVKGD